MTMLLTDLHIHSNFSDGRHSIPEIVDFYGKRGFKVIAITDHLCDRQSLLGRAAHLLNRSLTEANFPLYLNILKSEAVRALKTYGMLVIPGYEITLNTVSNSRSAHLLVLGYEKLIRVDQDITRMLKEIRSAGALSIAAHPVSTRKLEKQTYFLWDRREELAPLFDAWEVASGPHMFTEVLMSGLPMIANSDLHHFKQMKSWKSLLNCQLSRESVFEAIRKQNLSFTFFDEENCYENRSSRRHFIMDINTRTHDLCELPVSKEKEVACF